MTLSRRCKINAATQLGQLDPGQVFAPLLAVVTDPARPGPLRSAAASALGSLKDRRALPVLAELSRTHDPDLLAGAIDGLAELRDPAGIPYLEALLERPDLDERTNRAIRLGLLAMERYRQRRGLTCDGRQDPRHTPRDQCGASAQPCRADARDNNRTPRTL